MRVILATMLIAGALTATRWLILGHAEPDTCPPVCDRIPNTAWMASQAVPLDSVYRWPALAGVAMAVTGATPRFRFEELCGTPAAPQDTHEYAVAGRAAVANPDGQWQLQAQVLHWRGDTWLGGQLATSVFNAAVAALRTCQGGAPSQSPSITTVQTNRMAAVISAPVIMHSYLVAHPQSSTISGLTLWSTAPPEVQWPATPDATVLEAMTAPLCAAYISSCQ